MEVENLIRLRFGTIRRSNTEWKLTRLSHRVLALEKVPFNEAGYFVPPVEWLPASDLYNFQKLIQDNSTMFRYALEQVITHFRDCAEACTGHLTHYEYSYLLSYGGQEIYDFFVHNHRFGNPPRGKDFRSNIRGEWIDRERHRPDNAIHPLERKIKRQEAMGMDTSDLVAELARRKACIARGEDPLVGRRRQDLIRPETRRGSYGKRPPQPRSSPYTLPLGPDKRPFLPQGSAEVIPLQPEPTDDTPVPQSNEEMIKNLLR